MGVERSRLHNDVVLLAAWEGLGSLLWRQGETATDATRINSEELYIPSVSALAVFKRAACSGSAQVCPRERSTA
jgi:hypothetical protein